MDYTLNTNEDYKDFIHRVLYGMIDQDKLQLFVFIMEMIITELGQSAYSVSLHMQSDEVSISFDHQGHAIKKNILDILYDQVDHLYYHHPAKDHHLLKLRKQVRVNNEPK